MAALKNVVRDKRASLLGPRIIDDETSFVKLMPGTRASRFGVWAELSLKARRNSRGYDRVPAQARSSQRRPILRWIPGRTFASLRHKIKNFFHFFNVFVIGRLRFILLGWYFAGTDGLVMITLWVELRHGRRNLPRFIPRRVLIFTGQTRQLTE